jgi:hypothetical protein
MTHQSSDDDSYDNDNELHEESETAAEGTSLLKKKFGNTIDEVTVRPTSVDADLLSQPQGADDETGTALPRAVDPAIARRQNKERLAAAQARFGKLSKLPNEPANDNFTQRVSWPLMDQLTRSTFEPDKERRTKLIATARYIRELIDAAGSDALGGSVHLPGKEAWVDYALQRTESGSIYHEHGQTLDRKKQTYDGKNRTPNSKNGESDAERYDGAVRTAKKSGPVSNDGFDVSRDEPFALRLLAAREELNAVISAVGPLWPSLVAVISEDSTLTSVGHVLGAKSVQASGVGSVIIRLAINAAMEALARHNKPQDESARRPPLPEKARGCHLNQAAGPVISRAAVMRAA